ncbi:hypothetical protein OG196_26030 [Kitasatospora purpeofusca]|uniref:hypothetical protein n=1 Tax=Kitasatospora purpeofusca TaxID=67352 RepID=UPI002E15982B|nr:hypothetical protein OG196_26030 [Kitasatospora purpeofusca]
MLWFIDTSSLVTLAADDALRAAIERELGHQRRVLLDVVVDELEFLAAGNGDARGLAAAALEQLAWLGEPVDTADLTDSQQVLAIQEVVRGGRPLKHEREHWAESMIMNMSERLTLVRPQILTEDHGVRVESLNHGLTPFSVHKLLSTMVRSGRLDAGDAVAYADSLKASGRGQSYTAQDFMTGRLRRVGHP